MFSEIPHPCGSASGATQIISSETLIFTYPQNHNLEVKEMCVLQGRVKKLALRRFLWAAQIKLDFDADKLLMNCKLFANSFQSVFKLCAISEQILCRHMYTHTDKNTSCCISRVAFIAKKDAPSPVYCVSVHKTSLLYKCTKNQLNV